jgi:hypothetical protein
MRAAGSQSREFQTKNNDKDEHGKTTQHSLLTRQEKGTENDPHFTLNSKLLAHK